MGVCVSLCAIVVAPFFKRPCILPLTSTCESVCAKESFVQRWKGELTHKRCFLVSWNTRGYFYCTACVCSTSTWRNTRPAIYQLPLLHIYTPIRPFRVKANWAALIKVILQSYHTDIEQLPESNRCEALSRGYGDQRGSAWFGLDVSGQTATVCSCCMKINIIQMFEWMLNQHLCACSHMYTCTQGFWGTSNDTGVRNHSEV